MNQPETVQLYTTVVVEKDGHKNSYTIVKPEEIDVSQSKISDKSPLGMALLNHKIAEIVKVQTATGPVNFKILNIL